jgi:ABC-type phosphate transport system auxiliary subunit
MLAAVLFVAAAVTLIAGLLLVLVVVGIRQEPPNAVMARQARRPAAALVRHLTGVYVRRPSPAEDTDTAHHCSCLAGHGTEGDGR